MDTKKELLKIYEEVRHNKRSELWKQIGDEKNAATQSLRDTIASLQKEIYSINQMIDAKHKDTFTDFDKETLQNKVRLLKGEVDINEVI